MRRLKRKSNEKKKYISTLSRKYYLSKRMCVRVCQRKYNFDQQQKKSIKIPNFTLIHTFNEQMRRFNVILYIDFFINHSLVLLGWHLFLEWDASIWHFACNMDIDESKCIEWSKQKKTRRDIIYMKFPT